MLFTIALVLLTTWLLGLAGAYNVSDLMHILLLIGLMLLLLRVLESSGRRRSAYRG